MKKDSQISPFILELPNPMLIVISGPSGVGKDSVLEVMKSRGLPFHFVITATTRAPRPDEQDGVDYFFLSQDEFARMIDEGELLEYAVVYQDYKGIPKSQVREALASGKNVIMRIDVQGAETVRKLAKDALLIFLTPQNEEELINRLEKRNTETRESLDETVDNIEAIIKAEQHRVDQRVVEL